MGKIFHILGYFIDDCVYLTSDYGYDHDWNFKSLGTVYKILHYDVDSPKNYLYIKKVCKSLFDILVKICKKTIFYTKLFRLPVQRKFSLIMKTETNPMFVNVASNTNPAPPIEPTAPADNKINVLEIEVNRSMSKGFQVFLKSTWDWSFLRRTPDRTGSIGGVVCYMPKSESLPGIEGFFAVGTDAYEHGENMPNLGLLLAKDLKQGVTFNFGQFPISEEKIESWGRQFQEIVRKIFLQYCKKVNIKYRVTTETIAVADHE